MVATPVAQRFCCSLGGGPTAYDFTEIQPCAFQLIRTSSPCYWNPHCFRLCPNIWLVMVYYYTIFLVAFFIQMMVGTKPCIGQIPGSLQCGGAGPFVVALHGVSAASAGFGGTDHQLIQRILGEGSAQHGEMYKPYGCGNYKPSIWEFRKSTWWPKMVIKHSLLEFSPPLVPLVRRIFP